MQAYEEVIRTTQNPVLAEMFRRIAKQERRHFAYYFGQARARLTDNKRAQLVGEKTFGEGAQQKTFELPDGAALILSVAKYESPSGKKLQDDAVTPGVLVASNTDNGLDDDDDAAPAASQPVAAKPSVSVDEQLTKALDILKSKAA